MKRPAEVYCKSEKEYFGEKAELAYGRGMKRRKVNGRGWRNFQGRRLFIGNPISGYHVGLSEHSGQRTEAWFDNFLLGEIDCATGQIIAKGTIIQQAKS
jgi:hypothetical protein